MEARRADVQGLLKEVEAILASRCRVVSPTSSQVLGVESACGTFHERDLTNVLWAPKQNGTLVGVGTKVNPTSSCHHPGDVCGCLAEIRSILFSTSPLLHGLSRLYRETWYFRELNCWFIEYPPLFILRLTIFSAWLVPPLETWV